MRCRGESIVRRNGISELTRSLEAGALDTQAVLRLYCRHGASIRAARDTGVEPRTDLLVEAIDGVDHVRGSSESVPIAEFLDTVSLAEAGDVPAPGWCRADA